MEELSRRSFLKGLAGVVAGLVIPDIWIPKKTEAADIEIYRGNVISIPINHIQMIITPQAEVIIMEHL